MRSCEAGGAIAVGAYQQTILPQEAAGSAAGMPDGLVPPMADVRFDPAVPRSFEAIASTLFEGEGEGESQKVLSVAHRADAVGPVKMVWGDRDAVVPVGQIERFPPNVARHVLPNVGHIPHLEAEALVIRLILENVAAAAWSQTP